MAGEVGGCRGEVERLGKEKAEGLRRVGELGVRVQELEGECSRLGYENFRLESECASMGSELKLVGTEGNILMAVRAQKECILADLQRTKNQNSNFSAQIEQLQSEIKKSAKARIDDVSTQHQEISAMLAKVQRSELQCNSLRAEKNSLKKENTDYRNHIGSLESLLCVKEDVYAQLQSSLERNSELQTSSDKLRTRLETNQALIETQSEKIFDLEKLITSLRQCISEKDQTAQGLMRSIIELKLKHQTYLPFEDDEVDSLLSEFINQSENSNSLAKLFFREDTGVYGFGTKKIFLKMENSRLFVKTGGGFVGLQEFLGANVGPELERVGIRENSNLGEKIRSEVEGRDSYGSIGREGVNGKGSFVKRNLG